ncbi:putative serine/threonine-protein kinase, partial [Mucuna pruriens]
MGCICSKYSSNKDKVDEYEKEKESSKTSVQLVAPVVSTAQLGGGSTNGSVPRMARSSSQVVRASVKVPSEDKSHHLDAIKSQNQRCMPMSSDLGERKAVMSRILSVQNYAGEHVDAGWPLWLSSVAAEAIKGWVPRRADSFEKLDQIGQGAYSSVHKARDLETGKLVALKKVRFSSTDAESVRFMAREIFILRQLDHPNVMKLEGLVTSRMSTSLYLVFEYMEHDLAGISTIHGLKLTEPQIKCYMQQLLRGLEHCHSRGVLHRDIKGSNLLIDNDGNLKIADFGLATVYDPDKKKPLTSRVVTLWYRAPELLLGATEYGAAIDLWSVGCILAEMLAGKPIMPGRTEVEQMHKIFKLCGSPSEDYWQRTKFPHATSFKPQHPYNRQVADTFKNFSPPALALVDKLLTIEPEDRGSATSALQSEFFTTDPLPCDPSSLPKFPPSKEFDSKRREKEVTRKNAEAVKGRGPASVFRGAGDTKALDSPEYTTRGNMSVRGKSNTRMSRLRNESQEDDESCNNGEPTGVSLHNGYTHSTSLMPNSIAGPSSLSKKAESSRMNPEFRTQRSHVNHAAAGLSTSCVKKELGMSAREPVMGFMPKKNRIHCSGPLMPPGGTIDDMLREHERLMQDVFRSVKKANPWRMPLNDKQFIEIALLSDLRVDGRRPSDYRKLSIKLGKEDGSAEVHLGQTHVMTFVTAQLVRPYRDRPNEGSLSIFTEFSPMADPSFEPGRPTESAVELGRIVDRGLRESRAVDTESLCVLSGKLVWAIRVDIHILDNAGNLVDAANIAALASLLTFRRPECSLAGEDGQEVVVHPPEQRDPIPLIIHHLPIAVTFGFFSNENLVIDPTHHEECVMTGRMTATLNSNGDVCAIQKAGGEGISRTLIMRCFELAHAKATDITTKIKDAVEIHNNERALRKIKRHSSAVAVDVCGATTGLGESQNQLDELKVKEHFMECEATPSGQVPSKDAVAKNFVGAPSRSPVPSKQKDPRRETKPKEPPQEIKTDSSPIDKALTAGQNSEGHQIFLGPSSSMMQNLHQYNLLSSLGIFPVYVIQLGKPQSFHFQAFLSMYL